MQFFSQHTVNKMSAFSFADLFRVNTAETNGTLRKKNSQYVPCIIGGLPTDDT